MIDNKIASPFAKVANVHQLMREVLIRKRNLDGSYESRNKSDRKRDKKNRWR